MANLLKFFRVEALPTTGGVLGGLYFVHGGDIAAGNGKLYVCTADNTFELYSGANDSELSTKLGDYVLKTQTIAGIDLQDNIPASELMLALKSLLDNSVQEGKFITGFTVNADGKLEATYEAVETTDTTYSFASATGATSGAYFTVTEEGKDAQTVYVNADVAGTAETLINALDLDDKAVDGKYVASVSQVNGQISVTRADLPAESFTGVRVDGTTLTIGNDKTVNWGLNYDSTTKLIQVLDLNKGNAVLDYIDATSFVKDGLLYAGELVWCTIAEDGTHTEVAEGTKGAVHCLKLTLRVYNRDVEGSYSEEYVHIPLGELCDPYAGTAGEILVEEEHGKHVISLADKTVAETTGTALTPAMGTPFNVVTDVTYDTKGRIAGVETTQVTLPTIADGDKTGADDYVSVQVKTAAGAVSEVTVNTDELSKKLSGIEADITEVAQVTAAALVDLDSRLDGVEAGTIKSVTGEATELNNTEYVNVKATTENGAVTLASSVKAVKATDDTKYSSTGLATDGYVNEKIATVSATAGTAVQNIDSEAATIQVTRAEGKNDVNLELVWAAFE